MYVRIMLGVIGVLALIIAVELKQPRKRTAAPLPAAVADEPPSEVVLDRRLAEISFDHVPLERALAMLGAQAHANIVVDDWKEILRIPHTGIEPQTPLTLK